MSDLLTPWTVGCYDPRYVFDRHGEEVAFFSSRYEVAVPQARLTAAAPELLAVLNQQLTQLQLLANLIDDETALATIELSAEMIAKVLEKAQ